MNEDGTYSKRYEAGKLFIGRENEAMERICQVCSGSIPERLCENSPNNCHPNEQQQLDSLMTYALWIGETDFIQRHVGQCDALFRAAETEFSSELNLLVCVWFERLETQQQAVDWLLETLTDSVHGQFYTIDTYLCGWIYFQFLAQAGVQEIEQTFPALLRNAISVLFW